jgi:hypothetical protein
MIVYVPEFKDFIKPTTQDMDRNPRMRANGIIEHD